MGVDVSLLYGMHVVAGLLPDARGSLRVDPVTGKRRDVYDIDDENGVEQQWSYESSVDVARFWGFSYKDFLKELRDMLIEQDNHPDSNTDGAWYHYVWSTSWSLWDSNECRVIAERLAQYAEMAAQWQLKLDAEEDQTIRSPDERYIARQIFGYDVQLTSTRSDDRTWYDSYVLMQQLFTRAAAEGAWMHTI